MEVNLGEDIGDGSVSVVFEGAFVEEVFHHVEESVVLGSIDPWILDDEAPVLLKGISNSLTIFFVVSCSIEEVVDIDNGDGEG